MVSNLLESGDMQIILLALCLTNLILLIICLILSTYAAIRITAVEKSTHTVTYQTIDEEVEKANQDYLKEWATSERKVAEDQQQYAEDLETELPDFFPDDDDRKIHSF